MMKRFYVILGLLLTVCSVYSQWRTPETAYEIAVSQSASSLGKKKMQSVGIKPAFVLQSEDKTHSLVYGFNYSNGGFVLVSGCEYTPEILGYSDRGSLSSDAEDMPDGFRYLMDVYQSQITMAASVLRSASNNTVTFEPIEPLISTHWSQRAPYNDKCPQKSLVGCIGVVMGQIMKYHRWPMVGTGTHNNYDFSQKRWDWNLMLDSYTNGNYTEEQSNEVAELLHLVGESVDMRYGAEASAAPVFTMIESLKNYWKYDDGMYNAHRQNYSDSQWEQLLFNELKAGRPVPYTGSGGESRHAFIVDGYKNGQFHINWGWGENYDGYFSLHSFVPESSNPTAYKLNQDALINVMPADDIAAYPYLETDEWHLSSAIVKPGESVDVKAFVMNYSLIDFNGKIGVIVTDMENKSSTTVYASSNIYNLAPLHAVPTVITVSTSDLKFGNSYTLTPIYIANGATEPMLLNMKNYQAPLTFKIDTSDSSKEIYPRQIVVEEGTGTWCPWCVRGIVAMETMKEKHPESFIGIAIHTSDVMECENDYGLNFSSYPSAFINRSHYGSVSSEYFESYLRNHSGLTTNAMVKVMSTEYSNDYKQMTVKTNTRFGFDATNTDYRLAYVITENNVGPYMQYNAYAGGGNGDMGGFENRPNPTEVIFYDVARGIYPSNTGLEGSVPIDILSCTDYSYEYTFTMPKRIDSYDNLELTVLLYDAKTGEIVNADRIACPYGKSFLEISVDTGYEPGTLEQKLGDQIYNIASLTVKGQINGTDLGTLRRMMGGGDTYSSTGDNKWLTHLDLQDAQIVKGGVYTIGSDAQELILEEDNILPSYVFYGTTSLQKIVMPKTLKGIKEYALFDSRILNEVVLNEGLEEIGYFAFAYSNLQTLHIPSTIKKLDATFISNCNKLNEFSISADNPYYVFDREAIYTANKKKLVCACPTFDSILTLDDRCKTIGGYATGYNKKIHGIIGKNVKNVDYFAFYSTSLECIAIGAGLQSINSTFNYNNKLRSIYLGCTEVPSGSYASTRYWAEIGDCTLYVPASAIDNYKAHPFWSQLKAVEPIEGTEYEYLKTCGLEKEEMTVDMGNNPGTLAEKLGKKIWDIESLAIKGQINGIDLGTLRRMMGGGDTYSSTGDNKSLTHLDLQDAQIVKGGVYTIDSDAQELILEEDDILPSYVFFGTPSLQKLVMPKTLKKINNYVLTYSNVLKEIILNEGLEEIGYNAFYDSSLEKLHIPSTVILLSATFISNCNKLNEFSISADNHYYVFDGEAIYRENKKELVCAYPTFDSILTLDDRCKTIGSYATGYNKKIHGIIGKNVKNVEYDAFYSTSLECIAIGAGLQSINSTFNYNNKLRSIYLGCTEVPSGSYTSTRYWAEIGDCTLYVPASAIDNYKAHPFWSRLKAVEPIEGTEYEYLKTYGIEIEPGSLTFVNAYGDNIADADQVVMNDYKKDLQGAYIPLKNLNIKNNSNKKLSLRLTATVKEISGGSFQCCMGELCNRISKPGSIIIDALSVKAGEIIPITNTEWYVEEGNFGNMTVNFTLMTSIDGGNNYTPGASVDVLFVYADNAGIETTSIDEESYGKVFTIDGRRVDTMSKGIYIHNGKKIIK